MLEAIKRLFSGNHPRSTHTLGILRQNYLEEVRLAKQFRQHAQKLRYKIYRDKLLALADEAEAHARVLAEKIRSMGGEVPAIEPPVKDGANDWERIRCDFEDEKELAEKYLHDAYELDEYDPEAAALLLSLRDDEKRHRDLLSDLLMRVDRYAI